jgi:hypothetical protein
VISAAENSNKFQKPRFWKEKSVEDMVTLGPTTRTTLIIYNRLQISTHNHEKWDKSDSIQFFKSVGLGSLIFVITASWGYLKKSE